MKIRLKANHDVVREAVDDQLIPGNFMGNKNHQNLPGAVILYSHCDWEEVPMERWETADVGYLGQQDLVVQRGNNLSATRLILPADLRFVSHGIGKFGVERKVR